MATDHDLTLFSANCKVTVWQMKELKPYLQWNLTTSCPLKLFLWTNAGQEHKPATISNFQPGIVQNEKKRSTVIERDDEDWLSDCLFISCVCLNDFHSNQLWHFFMRKLKNFMQDRQKPFSEFQQTTAVETFGKFCYKLFLKPCLYSTWFMYIEFVFKLVVACSFLVARVIKNTRRKPFWIQVTGSAF